jgi:hypothetical protein
MLLVSLGVVALALRPMDGTPVLVGHGRAVRFALANAVVIAIYTIVDGAGARLAGNPWSYIVWLFVLDAMPFTLYMLYRRRGEFLREMGRRRQARAHRRRAVGGGLRHFGVGDDEGAGCAWSRRCAKRRCCLPR